MLCTAGVRRLWLPRRQRPREDQIRRAVAGRLDAQPRVDGTQPAQPASAGRRARCSCGWCSAPRTTAGRWWCSMSSGVTDYLDGYLARRLDQTSSSGQILDPVADRLYILAVVVGLALRDIIPWWVALSLPLRDLLLWGLVPLLRTRGYSALPVHFLGKAATFNLLYAFPLLLLGDGDGTVATLASVFGWAFALWGIGLYWWAGILYAWQVRTLLATTETRVTGGDRMPDTATSPGPRHTPLPDADHPASRWTRTTEHVAARRAADGRRTRPPARRTARRPSWSACSACWSPSRPCRPPSAGVEDASRGGTDRPDRDRPRRGRRRCQRQIVELRELNIALQDQLDAVTRHRAGRGRTAPTGSRRVTGFVGGHRRGRPDHGRRRPRRRDDWSATWTCGRWSTGCGRPGRRRSRSTASGSPPRSAIRNSGVAIQVNGRRCRRRTSSRRSATPGRCRPTCWRPAAGCTFRALVEYVRLPVDHGQ